MESHLLILTIVCGHLPLLCYIIAQHRLHSKIRNGVACFIPWAGNRLSAQESHVGQEGAVIKGLYLYNNSFSWPDRLTLRAAVIIASIADGGPIDFLTAIACYGYS
jgi:hypothetical protein